MGPHRANAARRLWLPCLLLALCAVHTDALAQSAEDLWKRGTDELGTHDHEAAAELLEELVQQYPDHPLHDDALFLVATLYEEKLQRPVQARAYYRRLVQEHPRSRESIAAARRAHVLDGVLGEDPQDAQALIAFDTLLSDTHLSSEEGIEGAYEILRNHPQWIGRTRVLLWIASRQRESGHLQEAIVTYQSAIDSAAEDDQDQRFAAYAGMAEAAIAAGEFARADEILTTLASEDLRPGQSEALRSLHEKRKLREQRQLRLLASKIVLAIVLASFAFLLWWRVRNLKCGLRELLWPPPTEILFLFPILLLLFSMALTGHEEIAPALALIGGTSLGLSYAAGSLLRGVPRGESGAEASSSPSGLLTLSTIALSALGMVAVCYLALYRSQLLDLVITTLRFGPE